MIYNSGPTQELDLQPQFTADGLPKPLILVGLNGAGKTNVLSTIADAILELQVAAGFNDILPNNKMGRRLFYRLLGGSTTSLNRSFEVSVATFKHAESSFRTALRLVLCLKQSSISWRRSQRLMYGMLNQQRK
ncbi:hypothetical protein GO496_26260 [Acidovorax citrulli]|nr:hypothetical protein [Paracidovorax citrulli]